MSTESFNSAFRPLPASEVETIEAFDKCTS